DVVPLAVNNGGKMDNPYFAQFSSLNMEGFPEILMWRAYNLTDFGISHSTTYYLRVGGNTGFTRQFVETFLCNNGKPIYASPELYKGDKSIVGVKENRESRLQLFMMTPGELLSTDNKTLVDTLPMAPGIITKAEIRSVTGYMLRKGLADTWSRGGMSSIEGCPIFRAVEAHLNYIEASCIENGGNSIDSKAQGYWNAVRNRAQLPSYQITIDATDLAKESDWAVYSAGAPVSKMLYNIRRERRCELVEEGFRMDDLKRWRALDQVKNYQIEGVNLWGSPLKDMYPVLDNAGKPTGKSKLVPEGNPDPNVSSPKNSNYLRPYQIVKNGNLVYDGYNWCDAHYLSPVAMQHLRITATNPDDGTTSVIYQTPGWPAEPNKGPIAH
ncbi:MAG: RagB/SusD family nutrient uptake outer membrane protein, partial [Bacteroides sp.]